MIYSIILSLICYHSFKYLINHSYIDAFYRLFVNYNIHSSLHTFSIHQSFIHALYQVLIYAIIYSFILFILSIYHLFIHTLKSFNDTFYQSLNHIFYHSVIHYIIYSLIISLINLSITSFIHTLCLWFIRSIIHYINLSFICTYNSFIPSFLSFIVKKNFIHFIHSNNHSLMNYNNHLYILKIIHTLYQ